MTLGGDRMHGRLKWWLPKAGYGWLTTDTGKDVFVGRKAYRCLDGQEVRPGDLIAFTLVPGKYSGETQAANLRLLRLDKQTTPVERAP